MFEVIIQFSIAFQKDGDNVKSIFFDNQSNEGHTVIIIYTKT